MGRETSRSSGKCNGLEIKRPQNTGLLFPYETFAKFWGGPGQKGRVKYPAVLQVSRKQSFTRQRRLQNTYQPCLQDIGQILSCSGQLFSSKPPKGRTSGQSRGGASLIALEFSPKPTQSLEQNEAPSSSLHLPDGSKRQPSLVDHISWSLYESKEI